MSKTKQEINPWSECYFRDENIEASHTFFKRTRVPNVLKIDLLPIRGEWHRFLGFEFKEEIREELIGYFEHLSLLHRPFEQDARLDFEEILTLHSAPTLTFPVGITFCTEETEDPPSAQ